MREYSTSETLVANMPYIFMVLIGAVVIAFAYGLSSVAFIAAAGYFIYGIVGTFWIIVFVCPYCAYYANKGCPCGYGAIAAKIVQKSDKNCFPEKFKRHIPVIVPLWIIPVVCGGIALWSNFTWLLTGLILVFIIESWIILPFVSVKHGCVDCPQHDDCPWMGKKK